MNRRRGFALLEILGLLVLLAVVALVSARIFRSVMQVISETPARQEAMMRLDAMTDALRGDVWAAKSVNAPDEQTAVIADPAGEQVRWTFQSDAVQRERVGEPSDVRRWSLTLEFHVKHETTGLTLRVVRHERAASIEEEMRLPSQVLLAQPGATP